MPHSIVSQSEKKRKKKGRGKKGGKAASSSLTPGDGPQEGGGWGKREGQRPRDH